MSEDMNLNLLPTSQSRQCVISPEDGGDTPHPDRVIIKTNNSVPVAHPAPLHLIQASHHHSIIIVNSISLIAIIITQQFSSYNLQCHKLFSIYLDTLFTFLTPCLSPPSSCCDSACAEWWRWRPCYSTLTPHYTSPPVSTSAKPWPSTNTPHWSWCTLVQSSLAWLSCWRSPLPTSSTSAHGVSPTSHVVSVIT